MMWLGLRNIRAAGAIAVLAIVTAGAPLAAQPAAPLWAFGGFNLQRTNVTPRAGGLVTPHVRA